MAPFDIWSVDLLTHLRPTMLPTHASTLLVCVCVVSKWVEAIPLASKSASDVWDAFHLHVVCRYGAPKAVRSDMGSEFRAEFA